MKADRLSVRVPNWLGDAVMSLGALRDVRRVFPEARLSVLARRSVAGLYEAVPEVDEVQISSGVRADADLLRGSCDVALLFTNSFATALAPFLARAPERWGYASDARSALLTRAARRRPELRGRSEVYYHRAMLAGVGLPVSAAPDLHLDCPPGWSERGRALLGDGRWIGVNAGAAFGTAKRWPAERYAAAAEQLAREQDASVALLGAAIERPLAEEIALALRVPSRVLAGQTDLGELVGVLSHLSLLLTNDSGPMHVASALGVRTVAIIGPTDWRETHPAGPAAYRVVREPVHCSPCKLRDCPIDHRCMRRVTVDHVVDAARELLA